ncbi:MAG: ATP-binding protein [Sphingomonas fennica]
MTITERRFNGLILTLVALGFLALVSAALAAAWSVRRMQEHVDWVTHTYVVERAISDYRVLNELSEAARRGYLLKPNPLSERIYRRTAGRILPALDAIERLTRDNPVQRANVAAALPLSRAHVAEMNRTMTLVRAGRQAEAERRFALATANPLVFRVRIVSTAMMTAEAQLLRQRIATLAYSRGRFYAITGLCAVLLLLVAGSSLWLLLHYTRDLARSRERLARMNDTLEDEVKARTADLSLANAEIQRFAYIVSHDLRSPLVNVMGFTAELAAATGTIAELVEVAEREAPQIVTEEARLAAREDLPEAIGFIRTSTAKMDRLINAILKLSREGRRVIAPERIDLGAMVAGIRDSLAHRIAELDAEVAVADPLPTLVTDRVSIEQVLSNLIENALKYTAAGRPPRIQVSGWREGLRVIVEVADNGRGIDPRDHDRIFDLFRRSGTQDQPGEGIGLAHVRAVVYRLGGTIQCRSALGEGATFRISLPAAIAGDQGAES